MTFYILVDNFNNTPETPVNNNNQGFTFGIVDEDQGIGIS
ncbi:hypothetical protein SAMN02745229_01226 [Butyrivibrio fibrisolvens DSM 3071]|uniref:Uncharacterized protein n=1 Tax=Butyrivibrio fibrisolvens DSM 3071 TaxID=1121131 RepID=A0A1M5X1H8_BUTFI|nr:hypothetical protein SAMN02745229_01226 [Butyrivibrio fibrisolvens DSM 3071]